MRSITHFDASTFPTKIAGEVKDLHLENYVAQPDRFQHAGPNTRFAIAASVMAVRNSGLELDRIDRSRVGVYLGAGEGQADGERPHITGGCVPVGQDVSRVTHTPAIR